jgi:hypothetical protein
MADAGSADERFKSKLTNNLDRLPLLFRNWRPTGRRVARLWVIAAILTIAACLPTLTLAPAVFTDEIHIAEYGRLFLDPGTNWSIFWQGDHAITPWYYLGGMVQELATRAMAPSCSGTRLSGLLGALFASGTLTAWMLRRGTLPAAAFLLSLLFLFEPVFVGAYRGGRVDGWTLTCSFLALYLLATFATSPRRWHLFTAGALISLGFFVWPSIAFLIPLFGLELASATKKNARPLVPALAVLSVGAALTFSCLALVVVLRVPWVLADVPKQLHAAGMAPTLTRATLKSEAWTLCNQLLVRSPWHLPLLIVLWRSHRVHAAIFLMAIPISVMFATLLYGNRLIYLLPYLMASFSGGFPTDKKGEPDSRPASWWLLLTAVVCALGLSVVIRSISPWVHRESRSEMLLIAAAEKAAPAGDVVCLDGDAIEFYVAGRARNWMMFIATVDTIGRCQTVIARLPLSRPDVATALTSFGFQRQSVLLADQVDDAPEWETRVYGYNRYGPYVVYRRTANQ